MSAEISPVVAYYRARDIQADMAEKGEPLDDLMGVNTVSLDWLETIISTSPEFAFYYAANIIKRRWPEAEPTIAKSPEWAYRYAKHVINGRWPDGEPSIMKSEFHRRQYLKMYPEVKEELAIFGHVDWLDT